MRELYFNNHIDDAEYSGKLYGLGQTFTGSNGMTDPGRGGATIAEREDRNSIREAHNKTPGAGASQNQGLSMGMGQLTGNIQTPGSYGPMGANGPYLRTAMVGGGR